ncbi:FMN-binding protein [Sulfurimonas sp. SAG-AH-194-C20]|nr:FMN-binding protein [Sulfurimonas sp. SAG-AH-194-C20]MDF1879640.1 FMN-binding protein [Sulfurimonas sp. SAG-AH-194-C20]
MQKILLTLIFLLFHSLHAQVLISPLDAMHEHYGETATISKKNILLSNKKFKNIQADAKAKLDTKIYRIYTAKQGTEVLGYGILINRKVRSQNAVVLYVIANDILKDIEIIAFNETHEYLPSKKWNQQFHNTPTDKLLHLKKEIPSISGATMSVRSITDSSRIAFAIYNALLKGK